MNYVAVNTAEYVRAHGVEPTGRSNWRFDIIVGTQHAQMSSWKLSA